MEFLVAVNPDKQESNYGNLGQDIQLKMSFFPVQRRLYRAP